MYTCVTRNFTFHPPTFAHHRWFFCRKESLCSSHPFAPSEYPTFGNLVGKATYIWLYKWNTGQKFLRTSHHPPKTYPPCTDGAKCQLRHIELHRSSCFA